MLTLPLMPGDPARLGRFDILARLGEGGQGVVYLGRGSGPAEERVAVKVLRAGADPMVLERLSRELDAIHQVQPFVTAGVIEAAADGERWFVVSEFIDGPSLQDRIDSRGPLPATELHRLAVGTATALAAIHGAGVVHRDFKPANVLLGPDGPRVVDFGIARLIDAATITSGVIGTPTYMAPEQLSGERPGSAVDIFAWAATMVFAATGRPAFSADTIPAVMHQILFEEPDVSGVPLPLQPLVRQCLSKQPGRRPSARDLMVRLVDPSAPMPGADTADTPGSALNPPTVTNGNRAHYPPTQPARPSEPAQPGVPARPAQAARRPSRTPLLIGGGAVAAASLVVGGFLLFHHGSPPSHPGRTGAGPDPHASVTASSPPAPAATGPTIPDGYAGTWRGRATMTANGGSGIGLKSSITFTFVTGARTVHEVNDSCVDTLTLRHVARDRLVFTEPQTPECVAGTVTFRLRGARLAYRWSDSLAQNTALLTRS